MPLSTDIDRLAQLLDEAVAEANRLLEQRADWPVQYRVKGLMVEEFVYNEAMDEAGFGDPTPATGQEAARIYERPGGTMYSEVKVSWA